MLAASLAVVSLVWITQWNLKRGFLRFVKETERAGIERLTESLQDFYASEGSWQRLQQNDETWRELIFYSLPHQEEKRPPSTDMPPPPAAHRNENKPFPPPPFIQDLPERYFLLDSNHNQLIGPTMHFGERAVTPLHYRGQIVGYLGYFPIKKLTDDRHLHFLHEQKQAFIMVAGIIVVLSGFLSYLLTRKLVRPLKSLAAATHTLTGGDFSCRVPVTTTDELGSLATDFNLLALTLEKNEQARRQWVADISHELRTPIGILRGEIEALQDGIRQADVESLQSLQAETLRLGRLVDDLYQLSMSDLGALSYRKSDIVIADLIAEVIESYRHEFNLRRIHLTQSGERDAVVFGDPQRLHQLFSNLLDNSLKYTDMCGRLEVIVRKDRHSLIIDMQDSSPAVPEQDLSRLFERLYRADSSRSRTTGGAGLGLSICQNIVEAHRGTISAYPSPLGGLWIQIRLPVAGAVDVDDNTGR